MGDTTSPGALSRDEGATRYTNPFTMIERITILGTGLIGASVGLALRAHGFIEHRAHRAIRDQDTIPQATIKFVDLHFDLNTELAQYCPAIHTAILPDLTA